MLKLICLIGTTLASSTVGERIQLNIHQIIFLASLQTRIICITTSFLQVNFSLYWKVQTPLNQIAWKNVLYTMHSVPSKAPANLLVHLKVFHKFSFTLTAGGLQGPIPSVCQPWQYLPSHVKYLYDHSCTQQKKQTVSVLDKFLVQWQRQTSKQTRDKLKILVGGGIFLGQERLSGTTVGISKEIGGGYEGAKRKKRGSGGRNSRHHTWKQIRPWWVQGTVSSFRLWRGKKYLLPSLTWLRNKPMGNSGILTALEDFKKSTERTYNRQSVWRGCCK